MSPRFRTLAPNPFCAALLLFFPTAAHPALLIVPDSHATIQSAIQAAASGDSIMVRAGTYLEALVLAGKNVTLFGESGAESTLITSKARVFDIGAGVGLTTVLSDLTIRGGFADDGGGIRLTNGASPSLRRSQLMFNTSFRPEGSSWGGAMFAGSGSSPVIEDCLFRENVADYLCCDPPGRGHGGAISASASSNIRVVRTTFVNNYAAGFEGGFGGAIHVESGGLAILEECTFHENWAFGGGVGSAGTITIQRCVFTGHLGYMGAAVFSDGGQCTIEQSLFYDNESWGEPGVIRIHGNGPNQLRNNTIAFNTGGGISIAQAVASLQNNIIISNSEFGLSCSSPAPGSIACNDVWDNSPNYEVGCPDITGTDGNISLDPKFCDVVARDLRLRDDSPCAPGASACGLIGALSMCSVAGQSVEFAVRAPRLLPLRPNPVLPPARIAFELPAPGRVELLVYDAMGRRMATPADGWFEAGRHEVIWAARTADGRDLSSGVYFLALEAGGMRRTERLVLIR